MVCTLLHRFRARNHPWFRFMGRVCIFSKHGVSSGSNKVHLFCVQPNCISILQCFYLNSSDLWALWFGCPWNLTPTKWFDTKSGSLPRWWGGFLTPYSLRLSLGHPSRQVGLHPLGRPRPRSARDQGLAASAGTWVETTPGGAMLRRRPQGSQEAMQPLCWSSGHKGAPWKFT